VNSAHDAPVIHALPYDHPDVQALVEGLQQLYVEIYGGRDESPTPVGMGAWRLLPDGRGELKRLFVRPGHRGRGVSRALLGWLEDSARASGVAWMVLETNTAHPEAIQLYRSAGYEAVADYGHYADEPETVSLGREL
jgi:GNAT superfamily N-acetyltransferase